jgi:hypothetical protein
MPRHLKKTAVKPTSGMPQTRQLAASGGVWVSKGALIPTYFLSLNRREGGDDFICGHNGTGIVRDIDVESGVHFLIRVIRGRVFYHRDLVAKLSGIANSRLHTSVCYESHDYELMDAVLLELQIHIGVGKATGTLMLEGHNVARLRHEFAADLAAPGPVFKALSHPRCLLNRRASNSRSRQGDIDGAAHTNRDVCFRAASRTCII